MLGLSLSLDLVESFLGRCLWRPMPESLPADTDRHSNTRRFRCTNQTAQRRGQREGKNEDLKFPTPPALQLFVRGQSAKQQKQQKGVCSSSLHLVSRSCQQVIEQGKALKDPKVLRGSAFRRELILFSILVRVD